jgi:hypothetical protein
MPVSKLSTSLVGFLLYAVVGTGKHTATGGFPQYSPLVARYNINISELSHRWKQVAPSTS